MVYGLRLQVRPPGSIALATREFTCGLALASETEDRCLAMTHPRVCVRAAKGSVSSLDHHGGVRTLDYQKKKKIVLATYILIFINTTKKS